MTRFLIRADDERPASVGRLLRPFAAALLAAIAAFHLVTLADHVEEAAWLGALFGCAVAGALLAAAAMLARRAVAWILGAAVALPTAVGFVLAATVGLGDVHETFHEFLGIPSLIVEAVFLLVALWRFMLPRVPATQTAPSNRTTVIRRPHVTQV